MNNYEKQILENYLDPSNKVENAKAVNFAFGGWIAGITKVASIIKTGGEIVRGVSGIITDLFGNKRRVKRGFKDPTPYLKEIKRGVENIQDQNKVLFNRLNEIEDKIITSIVESEYLDSRHVVIQNNLDGIGDIQDINVFSGVLANLSENEYRAVKVPNIIYGFEGFIANYVKRGEKENSNEFGSEAIRLVLLWSKVLETNFKNYRDFHEQEIDLLVGQLLGYHQIASEFDSSTVKTVYDYNDDRYTVDIKNIHNFDLVGEPKTKMKNIFKLHNETKVRIEELVNSRNLYISMAELIENYNDSLYEDRSSL